MSHKKDYEIFKHFTSIQVVAPEGYCVRKEFYVPDYDEPERKQDKTPDLRTTIYWNPVIHTDPDGKAEVSFFTADNTGNYSYIPEGIGDNKVGFEKNKSYKRKCLMRSEKDLPLFYFRSKIISSDFLYEKLYI